MANVIPSLCGNPYSRLSRLEGRRHGPFSMTLEYRGQAEVIFDRDILERLIPRMLKFANELVAKSALETSATEETASSRSDPAS